jgi:hypothetical protein
MIIELNEKDKLKRKIAQLKRTIYNCDLDLKDKFVGNKAIELKKCLAKDQLNYAEQKLEKLNLEKQNDK